MQKIDLLEEKEKAKARKQKADHIQALKAVDPKAVADDTSSIAEDDDDRLKAWVKAEHEPNSVLLLDSLQCQGLLIYLKQYLAKLLDSVQTIHMKNPDPKLMCMI